MEELEKIFIELFGEEEGRKIYQQHIEHTKKHKATREKHNDNSMVRGSNYEEKHTESI